MGDYPAIDKVKALTDTNGLYFQDSTLFESLAQVLPKYVHQADMQAIFEDLRDIYYDGISLGDLQALHNLAKACRKCPNTVAGAHSPLWNSIDPDVLFVAESPNISSAIMEYLVQNLTTAGFSSRFIAMTYINRCSIAKQRRYEPEEIANCTPFLNAELQILKPKLVIALGLVPTAVLLGTDVTLGQERGKIHWLGPYAILPTYAPAYVSNAGGNKPNTFRSDLSYGYEFVYGKQ